MEGGLFIYWSTFMELMLYISDAVLLSQNNNELDNLSLLDVHCIVGQKKRKEIVIKQCVSAVI